MDQSVKSAVYTARVFICFISTCYSTYTAETEVVEIVWQTLRRWKQVIRLANGRCRPIHYRRAVQAKQRTRELAHFTNVLSFRYVKFNFC